MRHEIEKDSNLKILAFSSYREFRTEDILDGLPVVDFEEINNLYDYKSIGIIIAIGYSQMNTIREKVFHDCQKYNLNVVTYISPKANVYSPHIGKGAIIRAAHIGVNVRVGKGCIINNNTLLTHDINLGDFCFVGAGSVFGGCVEVGNNCFIGLNSTIRDHVHLGDKTLVGAGAVVIKNAGPESVLVGNPARTLPKSSNDTTI